MSASLQPGTPDSRRSAADERDPCADLRRASRAITRYYDLVLAPCGLEATQVIILEWLVQRGQIAQSDLASLMSIGVDTLSRRLGSLCRLGLIDSQVKLVSGRRRKVFQLTPAGRAALGRAQPYWDHARQRFFAAMGADSCESLFRLCDAVVESCAAAEKARVPRRKSA